MAIVCDEGLKLDLTDGECKSCPDYERYGLVRKSSGPSRVSNGGSIHYILMLDSSGSMGNPTDPSSKWSGLMEAVKEFMSGLEKTRAPVKVSVIGYDDISEILFENQSPSEDLVKLIVHTGYGTDF